MCIRTVQIVYSGICDILAETDAGSTPNLHNTLDALEDSRQLRFVACDCHTDKSRRDHQSKPVRGRKLKFITLFRKPAVAADCTEIHAVSQG